MSSEKLKRDVWVEEYRPTTLSDIRGHKNITKSLQEYVNKRELPNLLFSGPPGVGKTAAAVAIAKELFGEAWETNFMELNASDERGIDVVRNQIKDFAKSSFTDDFRIIFLDEADALTSDAQAALRRTMEMHTDNVRFILSCNYASQIIDPIQSRCARYRFGPLEDKAVESQIREIASREDLELTEDAVDALVYSANGDMRRAINALQAASVTATSIDEEDIFGVTNTVRPEDIDKLLEMCKNGNYLKAQDHLQTLIVEEGVSPAEIIQNLHRNIWEFDLEDQEAVELMQFLGEAEYRIGQGANERIQMDSLLATITDVVS